MQTILFGPEIAAEGIFPLLDTLERDASISDMLHVAVSRQKSDDILSASNYEQAPNIGTYLDRLINTAVVNERLISSTLHEFLRDYFEVGKDPMVPMLYVDDNKVEVNSIGAMQDDRLVGEFTLEEAFYVRLLNGTFHSGSAEVEIKTDLVKEYLSEFVTDEMYEESFIVVIDKLNNKMNRTLISKDPLKFHVELDVSARVIEMNQRVDLDIPEALKIIEEQSELHLKEEAEKILKEAQEMNSDIFGFGQEYSTHVRDKRLTKEEWRELYPDMEVDITINLDIERFGIIH
ncbi:Ger(x)C family spore germination protein [Halalkalibacillus halophilus]|uniref:Ger(x)C family spore germination protein n=1 Tax=Halalkalibacillus halophilus TaxID=392827 RepID=UPI0004165A70|nr:Ger(x)C family spore germination C-terminal domain-containing protein [Halalkalibacillus halophilus]